MAIQKTTLVSLIGRLENLDEVVLRLSRLDYFHPEEITSKSGAVSKAASAENPYTELADALRSACTDAGLTPVAVPGDQLERSSHDLNLADVRQFVESFRQGFDAADQKEKEIAKLVEEHRLNLSHLDEGAPGQERRCGIDLYALCARALTRLEEAARQRKITLTLTGACQRVDGAEKLLEEILFNLCDNAIKYNKEGGRVEVSVTREPQWVVLTVQDTGIGIPSGETDRVFERFYRVDKSHSKEIGGTGLGLSIVKHAAAYHDAKVHIDSQLGRGTRVQVRFHPSGEGQP